MSKDSRTATQPINILVTLDRNYLAALRTMLKSLFLNNPRTLFHVHLLHDNLSPEDIEAIRDFCERNMAKLIPSRVAEEIFADAPVTFHYSRAMYYRLLAFKALPDNIDKILYLDPDILVINPVRKLYDTDISGYLYAAAAHAGLTNLSTYVNQLRLNTFTGEYYYNSGVLLMNLELQRKEIDCEEVFAYGEKEADNLILPDQDILNALFAERILPLEDELYNYDCRRYDTYLLRSSGETTMDWVMQNTVLLHFCGKRKPWTGNYSGRFGALYKHYMRLAESHYVIQRLDPERRPSYAQTS